MRGANILIFLCGWALLIAQWDSALCQPVVSAVPPQVQDTIEWQPIDTLIEIERRLYGFLYGEPTYLTLNEWLKHQSKLYEQHYWMRRRHAHTLLRNPDAKPALEEIPKDSFSLFGGNFITIKPRGNLSLTAGYRHTKIDRPELPERLRKYGQPDFDADIRFSVVGSVGNLFKVNFNFDSRQVGFTSESQQLKLGYTGKEHHIIKELQVGNISFPSPSSLISGVQNLLGAYTRLQFGNLTVTAAAGEQQSSLETITIEGGAYTRTFELRADDYEANRHFFLARYFRDHYEDALSQLPYILSQVEITRVEVWVTNRSNSFQNTREIIALTDLAETQPHDSVLWWIPNAGDLPSNDANSLYATLTASPDYRLASQAQVRLTAVGLRPGEDFERVYARKLSPNEYRLHPKLGFISLNIALQDDDVVGVAFEFVYNGKTYRVGEFSDEVPAASTTGEAQVLFVKMLKSTITRTDLLLWDLMMKNVYYLGGYDISEEDFQLDIYYEEPGGGYKRYLPEGNIQGIPLIQVLNMDNLDRQGNRRPDGRFDFIEGVTVLTDQGRIILPVLEPFGGSLLKRMSSVSPSIVNKYIYQELYDSTKVVAMEFAHKNRYIIKGRYRSKGGDEISLGRLNIPTGSVRVTAGGVELKEGVDYTVDYTLGRIRILNKSILESGQRINVSFESQDMFSIVRKIFAGVRAEYAPSRRFSAGATWLRLSEMPFTYKVTMQEVPVTNVIMGVDARWNSESEWLTHLLNKLPLIESGENSHIEGRVELARFVPKESRAIRVGTEKNATIYLDDFEGARTYYNLALEPYRWKLSAPPRRMISASGERLFPETDSLQSLAPNYHRALMSWYTIDPVFYERSARTPAYIKNNPDYISNHYVREIIEQEVFPEKESEIGTPVRLPVFNVAFYPNERGPYNYNPVLTPQGKLPDPAGSWGGIMISPYVTDLEEAGIEYIEIWLMDPFIYNPTARGGDLYIQLGNLSEDVLPDGRMAYENGLPVSEQQKELVDTTLWGVVPRIPPVTNAFDNDPQARARQDVGLDGVPDAVESSFFSEFINSVQGNLTPQALAQIQSDPSADNFKHYLDPTWDAQEADILTRYKHYYGLEGNSPAAQEGAEINLSSTTLPDNEDINRDNTISQTEEYFQYRVSIRPQDLVVGKNYVVNKVTREVSLPNGKREAVNWYQIRIPIKDYHYRTDGITDFRSIRFVRMILTGFDSVVVLRFARLALVGSLWRIYEFELEAPDEQVVKDDEPETDVLVSVVNIEENGTKTPVPYVLPPGVEREVLPSGFSGVPIRQNEQALLVKVCGLKDGERKAVYRILGLDLRQFDSLKAFIHAEATKEEPSLMDYQLYAFVRLGTDATSNFYEYIVPLKLTPWGATNSEVVWPRENEVRIALRDLVEAKQERDRLGVPRQLPYEKKLPDGKTIRVVGTPDLSKVEIVLYGIYNPPDDGTSHCVETWFNELRVTGYQNYGGWAGRANLNFKLADIGNISVAGSFHTPGFGGIMQTITERHQDFMTSVSVMGSFSLHRMLGRNFPVNLPLFVGYTRDVSLPRYNPYEGDVILREQLKELADRRLRDSLRRTASTLSETRSLNLVDIKKSRKGASSPRPYHIENLSASLAYTHRRYTDPQVSWRFEKEWKMAVAYRYSPNVRYWEPLVGHLRRAPRYLHFLRDFNFTLLPSNIDITYELRRQFRGEALRPLTADEAPIPPYYDKKFSWIRKHALMWKPSRSLSIDFNARTEALVEEPPGPAESAVQRRQVVHSLLDFGIPTSYSHNINASYNVPTKKLPLVDWLTLNSSYAGNYSWKWALPAVAQFGNSISNSQTINVRLSASLPQLHNGLHKIYWHLNYRVNPPQEYRKKLAEWRKELKNWKEQPEEARGKRPTRPPLPPPPPTPHSLHGKFLRSLFTAVKPPNINYSLSRSSAAGGFLPEPVFAGADRKLQAPGWHFLLGVPADTATLIKWARKGWLTADTLFNTPFTYTEQHTLQANSGLTIFEKLTITFNARRTFSRTLSEIFKDTVGDGQHFAHLTPIETGAFQVSVWSFRGLFGKKEREQLVSRLKTKRALISQMLGQANPNSSGPIDTLPDYWYGYGPTATQVLVPAFITTYTQEKLSGRLLRNYFSILPLPEWNLTLSGIKPPEWMQSLVTSLSISHGYSATLQIASFKSSLFYRESGGWESNTHPVSGNFYPKYEIQAVRIERTLRPLLQVSAQLVKGWRMSISTSRTHTLELDLTGYQLYESVTNDYSLEMGGNFRNVKLPLVRGRGGVPITLTKPLEASLRISYSTTGLQIVHKLDQNISVTTGGMSAIRFNQRLSYSVSASMQVALVAEWSKTIPRVSRVYPQRTYFIGTTLTYTLTGL